MTDKKKTHRFKKIAWRYYGEKYTWDFDISSQQDWDEVLDNIYEGKLSENNIPKQVPSDLKVWESAISLIDYGDMATDEADVYGDYTWDEDTEVKEIKE